MSWIGTCIAGVFKIIGLILGSVLWFICQDDDSNTSNEQLDSFSDGLGGVTGLEDENVDTIEEAKVVQDQGQLYNRYHH